MENSAPVLPYRPTNGSEGRAFTGRFCYHCARDAKYRETDDGADGCAILAATLIYDIDDPKYPREWIEDDEPWDQDSNPRCTAFEDVRTEGPIPDARQFSLGGLA